MKKIIARFTALSLSLVMLLGLTACGGEKKPSADVETPPVKEDLTNPRWDLDTEDGGSETPEPTPEPTPDLSILNFDFPNTGKQDDGTVNAPEYVVTLHGGVEVKLQDDVATQCVKLAGFGQTVDTPSSISISLRAKPDPLLMELPFITSLTWADIEAGLRQVYELREDVTFNVGDAYLMYEGLQQDYGCTACPPQTVVHTLGAQDNYGHFLGSGIDLYNQTGEELPFAQCPVAAVPVPNNDGEFLWSSADVYALLGEPAFARVQWNSYSKTVETVSYCWAGSGFFALYRIFLDDGTQHGEPTGYLRYLVDDPIVVKGLIGSEAVALLQSE